MAFGGDKGISKVEVSTDGGKTYAPADITAPGTKISWSQWRYAWTPTEAADEVRVFVRAVNGTGRTAGRGSSATRCRTERLGLHWVRARVDKSQAA